MGVLVLGDSFAFGEGVALERRFDRLVQAKHPSWSAVNLGVMGYGTDQQLIAARRRTGELQSGDAIVLLTYRNNSTTSCASPPPAEPNRGSQ